MWHTKRHARATSNLANAFKAVKFEIVAFRSAAAIFARFFFKAIAHDIRHFNFVSFKIISCH
jgi:hypothetical protein